MKDMQSQKVYIEGYSINDCDAIISSLKRAWNKLPEVTRKRDHHIQKTIEEVTEYREKLKEG